MMRKEKLEVIQANQETIKALMQVKDQWVLKDQNFQGKVIPSIIRIE